MSVSLLPAHAITPRETPIRYEESTKGSLWFIAKGVIFTVLTVGIYRFWFATALRKNLWSRAFIDGSPVEYTGKAHELLLGFLVAVAILLPVYIVVFVITMLSPYPTLSFVVAYLLLFLLVQFARYRARRYLASRTAWRGIRLRQDGSALRYTALAAGWWLLTLLSLGVAYPFMRASLERYRINHTLLGETRFISEADGLSVIFNWMIVWALSILPILGCAGILLVVTRFRIPTELFTGDKLAIDALSLAIYFSFLFARSDIQAISLIVIGSVATGFVLRPYYRGSEARAFLNSIALHGAKLKSKLSVTDLYINYFGLYFFTACTIALTVVLNLIVMFAFDKFGASQGSKEALLVNSSLSYVVIILIFSWIYFRFMQVGRLAILAETLTLTNADALDTVTASRGKVEGRLAEGMADAIDPGGIEIGF